MGMRPSKICVTHLPDRVHTMKDTVKWCTIIGVERDAFEALVIEAIEDLPSEFKNRLDNVAIVVADWPSRDQLGRLRLKDKRQLLGLYEGIPRTQRGRDYNLVPPDKITLFQKSIEAKCRTVEDVRKEIVRVVKHEIAHHFGLSDATLRRLEGRRSR